MEGDDSLSVGAGVDAIAGADDGAALERGLLQKVESMVATHDLEYVLRSERLGVLGSRDLGRGCHDVLKESLQRAS